MTTPEPSTPAAAFKIEDMPIAVRPEEAPLIFADGFQGLAIFNESVRINAYQISQNLDSPESQPYRVFVARIAMSPSTALQLMKWLEESLRQAGVTAVEGPASGNAP